MNSDVRDQGVCCDAGRPSQGRHITTELTRADSIILFATMHAGKASRGVLLSAVADALKLIDGKADIYTLFIQASLSMSRREVGDDEIEQVPEMRSTLRRLLILPKPKKHLQEEPEANNSLKEELYSNSNLQEEPSLLQPRVITLGQEARKMKIEETKSRLETECVII